MIQQWKRQLDRIATKVFQIVRDQYNIAVYNKSTVKKNNDLVYTYRNLFATAGETLPNCY